MEVTREGFYKCRVVEHGLSKNDNGYFEFQAQLVCTEFKPGHWEGQKFKRDKGAVWEKLEEAASIRAFLYLTGVNGANQYQIDALTAAFKLAAFNPTILAHSDFSAIDVEATITASEYEGKARMRVDWINAAFGVKKANATELASMDAEWAALSSGTPVTTTPEGTLPSGEDIPF